MKKAMFYGMLVFGLSVSVLAAQAADFIVPTGNTGSVTISGRGELGNVYVAGGSVTVNDAIGGDLFAAGGTLSILGEVDDDLFAAGGTINVTGPVDGDVRASGGSISINNEVGGEILAAGGSVTITSTVGGDVHIGGGDVHINGPIAGNVKISAESLTFGPQARVTGQVTYFGPDEAVVEPGAQVGTIDFRHEPRHDRSVWAALFSFAALIKLLTLFAAGWAFNRLFPTLVMNSVLNVRHEFWSSLGTGLVAMIVTPLLAILLAATLVGMYAGVILFLAYLVLVLLATLISLIFIGAGLGKALSRNSSWVVDWPRIALGALAVVILGWIPLVGWLAVLIFMLAAFGALLKTLRAHWWPKVSAPPAT